MTYPGWLPLAITGCLYLWQMAEYASRGQHGMTIVFAAYALGNLGFILDFVWRIDG